MLTNKNGDKVTRICDICGNVAENLNYWNLYKKDTHKCHTCANKLKNKGRIPYNKGNKEQPKCIGNIYTHSDGYPMVWTGAHNEGHIPVHRLVASYENKKFVTREEKVHHIDGDKSNFNTYNLYICNNMSHHRKVHAQLEKISFSLVKCGLIQFDKKTGQYFLSEKLQNLCNTSNYNIESDNFLLKELVCYFYNVE